MSRPPLERRAQGEAGTVEIGPYGYQSWCSASHWYMGPKP